MSLPHGAYLGADLEPAGGVDVVVHASSGLPFADQTFDLVIASSVFEHDPWFWKTFLEVARVTRDGGIIYLNVPSNGAVHRYPYDCWRFYPDAGEALSSWAVHNGYDIQRLESFISDRKADMWNDFSVIFCRGQNKRFKGGLFEVLPSNNILSGSTAISLTGATQDMRMIDDLERQLAREKTRAAAYARRLHEPPAGGVISAMGECSASKASGWALQDWAPERRLLIEVERSGVVVMSASADQSWGRACASTGSGTASTASSSRSRSRSPDTGCLRPSRASACAIASYP